MLRKKIISMFIAVVMLLALVPVDVSASPGASDYTFSLHAGKSYELTNTSITDIRVNNYSDSRAVFDVIEYNASGGVWWQGKDRSGGVFTVLDRGKTRVTVKGDFQLDLYVTSEEKDKLEIRETSMPVYYYFSLQPNKTYEFTNSSITEINFNNYSDGRARYDLIEYDSNGGVWWDGRDYSPGSFRLLDRGRTKVTVKDLFGLDLYIKYEDKENLHVKETTDPVFYYFTLDPNKTYEFENTSTFEIGVKNYSDGRARYDLIEYDSNGGVWWDGRDYSPGSFKVLDRGRTKVTVMDFFQLDLYVIHEDFSKMNIFESSMPAHYYFTFQENMTYEIVNTTTSDIQVGNYSDGRARYDQIEYDSNGNVWWEGKDCSPGSIRVLSSGKTNIAVKDIFSLSLYVRYEVASLLQGIPTPPGGYLQNTLTPYITSGSTQPATEYIYDATDPGVSVSLPVERLASINDRSSAVSAVESAASGMTAEQRQSATGVDLVTLFAEEAVSQAASTTVDGSNIVVSQSSVQSLQAAAIDARDAARQALSSSGVAAERELNADVKFKTEATASVTITIDPSAANMSADNVRIETPNYSVSLSAETIKADASDSPLVITITEGGVAPTAMDKGVGPRVKGQGDGENGGYRQLSNSFNIYAFAEGGEGSVLPLKSSSASGIDYLSTNTKTYSISLNKPVEEKVKISLPPASGDPDYQAVVNSKGEPVGGKFNPVKGKIEVKIDSSDTYTVRENKKDFSDISSKSKEMQNAINVLASKGIITGTTATTFSPDGAITRAQIAALIMRALSKLDANANGGFTDVKTGDWFYGAVGSAKRHGIVNGTSETTFDPNSIIQKDQIVAICARTLRGEMKYKDPSNASSILSAYSDSGSIAGWAQIEVALATRENMIVKRTDGNFNGTSTMTRGDAAIILYRLFMKIW